MLSLEKATAPEQLEAFVGRFPGQAFRVTPKLDGISLAVAFQDGELEYVATRGDGRDGERVTDKAQARRARPARARRRARAASRSAARR